MLPPGRAYEHQKMNGRIRGSTYGNGEGRAFGSGANASDIAKFDLHIVSCEIIKMGVRNRTADAMAIEKHTRMVIAGWRDGKSDIFADCSLTTLQLLSISPNCCIRGGRSGRQFKRNAQKKEERVVGLDYFC